MKIDVDWFNQVIQASRFGSLRQLAKFMVGRHGKPMDHSALSRMLNGEREMLAGEAVQLALLLDVPLSQVLKHAGVEGADSRKLTWK